MCRGEIRFHGIHGVSNSNLSRGHVYMGLNGTLVRFVNFRARAFSGTAWLTVCASGLGFRFAGLSCGPQPGQQFSF